jgi:RNA recognition motif-containing protein
VAFLLESFAIPAATAAPEARAALGREGNPQGDTAISRKVFVGNLSFDVTREELIEAFGGAGKVVDAKVPTDRETGRPRGFAFVEFEDEESVQRCIEQMHGKDLKGRPLRVNEAEDRPPRAAGGSGFSRGPGPGPRGPSGGHRPSPEYRADPPPDFPPAFEKDDRGGGRNKRFSQKPSKRRSSRRRRDQVVDDEDY